MLGLILFFTVFSAFFSIVFILVFCFFVPALQAHGNFQSVLEGNTNYFELYEKKPDAQQQALLDNNKSVHGDLKLHNGDWSNKYKDIENKFSAVKKKKIVIKERDSGRTG